MLFNVSVKSCCCDMIILSCVFYVGLGAGSLDISEGLMLLAVSRAPVNLTRLHMTLRIYLVGKGAGMQIPIAVSYVSRGA